MQFQRQLYDHFSYSTGKDDEEIKQEYDGNSLVFKFTIQPGDNDKLEGIVDEMFTASVKVKPRHVILFPYAHLTNMMAKPEEAMPIYDNLVEMFKEKLDGYVLLTILDRLKSQLRTKPEGESDSLWTQAEQHLGYNIEEKLGYKISDMLLSYTSYDQHNKPNTKTLKEIHLGIKSFMEAKGKSKTFSSTENSVLKSKNVFDIVKLPYGTDKAYEGKVSGNPKSEGSHAF